MIETFTPEKKQPVKEAKQVDLTSAYYNALTELFVKGKTDTNMPICTFAKKNVDNLFKKANDVHSADVAMRALGNLIKETQEYIDSKNAQDKDYTEYLINRKLIPWQKEFFTDEAKRITNQSGRRAGKSYANALKAIKHCLVGSDTINGVVKSRKAVIIGLTKEKVMEQYWQLIKDTVEECHINVFKIDNAILQVTFSTGATLRLAGNNSKAEREKLRGDEYSLVIIDEAQSQTGLRYLMESIIEPIAYGRDTQIILTGTGALLLGSYWQEVTDGDQAIKWRHYHVNMSDNPTVANPETVLEQVRKDKGWSEDDPEYVREYLGENCYDSTRIVLPNRKYYEKLPENAIWEECIIGLDYGFEDHNAFTPILVSTDGRRFVANVYKNNHMSASDIVAKAKEIHDWAVSLKIPRILFVADTSDQSISQDIWRQGVKVVNAYKVDQRLQWTRLKEAMATGTMLIQQKDAIDQECAITVWQYDEDKKQVIYEIDDDVFHPDALDALRYANYYIERQKRNLV